jgi:hypothetical protein
MTWPLADQTIQLHNLAVELALATIDGGRTRH